MEVYIIRHTRLNAPPDTCYGQSEVPLCESFAEEVAEYKATLPYKFDYIFSSPLGRCYQLAKQFTEDVYTHPALLELNFGDWEMLPWNDIDQALLSAWMEDFVNTAPPDGESLASMYRRVAHFYDNLRRQAYQRVLIVTHAGVIRCTWAYLLQIPLHNIFKIPVGYGEVFCATMQESPENDRIVRVT